MFRHFAHRRNLSVATVVLCLALAGCSDDEPQSQIDSLRSSLATVNAEVASLRASRQVLQNRLAAARIAARTAGGQLVALNSRVADLSARNSALEMVNAQGAQQLRAAEMALDHVSSQLAALSQSVSASELNNANLARQLAAVSSLLGQRDALGQSQENTLKSLESDLQQRSESMKDLSQELATRQQSLQQAQSKVTQLRAQNEQMATQLVALQSKFDAASERSAQRIAQLERERGELDATLSGMRTDSQGEQANARQLIENNNRIKARMETLRHELAEANDQALRYQVAKDYLIDKVQEQDEEINALKKAANDARTQHKATMATLLEQQDKLRAAASIRTEILNKTTARVEALQAEGDSLRDQLERIRSEYAASEQRARGAKQAKDYLDGKLSAVARELEEARSEHRTALLKNQHALRLSLEESRVLQQRERELSVQFAQVQKNAKQQETELHALRDEVEARIKLARSEGLVDGKAEGREAGLIEGRAEGKADLAACMSVRDSSAAAVRELKRDNDSLREEIAVLTSRVQELEAEQNNCAIQKAQLTAK